MLPLKSLLFEMKEIKSFRSQLFAFLVKDIEMQVDESILLGKPYVPPKIRKGQSIEEMERRWCAYCLPMGVPKYVAKIYVPKWEMVVGFKSYAAAQTYCDRKNKELGL